MRLWGARYDSCLWEAYYSHDAELAPCVMHIEFKQCGMWLNHAYDTKSFTQCIDGLLSVLVVESNVMKNTSWLACQTSVGTKSTSPLEQIEKHNDLSLYLFNTSINSFCRYFLGGTPSGGKDLSVFNICVNFKIEPYYYICIEVICL